MSFYLSDKDYKEMIGIISGNTDGKKGNDAGGTYIDMPSTNAEPKQQGIVADTVDAVQMGAWKGVSDIAHGLGALTGADWLHKVGDWAAEGADENLATMSDEMKVALNQNAFDGEDQGVRNVRWWAGNLGSLIGQNLDTVLTLGAGKAATFGVKQAGKMLLKKEAAEEVGKVAVEQAAKRGIPQKYWNMIGITATMSAMSGGSRYSQKRDDVMAMTNEQLSQIPQFSDAYYEIADSEEGKDKSVEEIYSMAKSRFADKVGRDAALNPTAIATDLATNAVSGLGGGFWGLGSPAKTIKGGLLKGAMVEGGTEAIQGVGEQYALNKAEQDNYNPNKDLTEGMADNAINSAVLGGVFGSAMGGLDTYTDRRAFNNQKRILLNHINTGNEAIDSQLKNYVDMLNQGAADLGDLVSASRVQALNNAGIANARARQAEEDARAQQQASAQFETDFFGEEQVAQPNQPEFTIDPQMERAVYVAKAIEKFRKGDLSGANEFISEPMVFADNQAKSQFVIGRSFDELKNIAQSYGLDPKDGKAMRQWIEDYIAKAREFNENNQQPTHESNLQFTANVAPENQSGVVSGANDEIDVGNGNYQPFQYEVVDATALSPTQQKDDNQFRDRDRTASQSQINNIARNLDPRKLAASPTMDMGAPLLALDGKTIIAGNGRTMAIRQAYQEGGADGYRQFLKDNAGHFGVDSAQLDAVENPVLVRRLTSPVDIAQVLGAYFDQAQTQGNLSQASMFGDVAFDKLGSLQQAKNVDEDIRLSLNESANSDFAKAVEDVFGSTNTKVKAESIYLGTTPKALIESGLDYLPMFMNKQKLVKIKHEHPEMTADLLKQIPQQINNPVAVFKNTKEGAPNNSYVVLTELQGTNGNPVISAIHANKTERGLEFHRIASVYGRNESSNYLTNMVKHSEVRFVDKQKARRINHTLQLLADDTLNELFDRASVVKSDGSVNTLNPEIQHAQDIIRKTFGKAAEHIEVATFANPPKDVRHLITSDVEGWFNPKTGKITIVADSIKPTKTMTKDERLQFVAWHEMAHRGINVGYKGTYENLMSEVGKNKAVSQIADAIQTQRKGTDDLAATNRSVAIEEAIAEIMAANETGKWNEIETRYGVEIKNGQRQSAKSWLAMIAQRIKEFLSKIFGVERVAQFSDDDVLNLVANIKKSAVGNFNESGNVRFSRNEELTEERYNQAKENGETELTFHQWQQVRSPEFKAWFGDWENDPENASRVVNERTGEPLVVYHGTSEDFNTFKVEYLGGETYSDANNTANAMSAGVGYWFSSRNLNEEVGYGTRNVSAYLNIREPNELPNLYNLFAQLEEYVPTDSDGDLMDSPHSFDNYEDITQYAQEYTDWNKRVGFDGLIIIKDNEYGGTSYVAFDSNQIKSATDNTGAFSKENDDIRFSRANTAQSALNLSQTAKAESEPSLWDDLKAKDYSSFKERFNHAVGKVDEWLADSLRPVNDWIDAIHLEDQTGSTSSRGHEKRRLKDAMYTAKGKRDAMNSELEQAYLKPILSKIAALSKETKKGKNPIDELTMKRLVGNWISARYSIEKNIDLLNRDEKVMRDTKRLLDNAKQNGTSAEVRRLNEAYLKAKEQYDNRKSDIYNTDYKNKGNRFKVGVAGGWSIPEAELILKNTERRISKSDLESVAEMIYDLNQARLEIDRASGRYTEKEYQEYKANRHYVPLTGDPNADVDTDIISGASSSAVNIGRDKTLKGRTSSEAEDAIDAMWKSVGKSTTYAGFAEFKGKIDDLYETEVTMLKEKGYFDSQAREQATANLGISKRKMQGLTRSSDNVLIRKEGGEYYEYELPKQAMEALRNDNVEYANAFLKLISKPTGWYARGVTQWTVTFAPMNMMRDTWEKSEFIRVQKLYDKNNRLVDNKTMDKIGRATIANAFTDKEVWQATKRLGFGQELRDSVPAERMLKQLLKEGGVSNYGTYLDKSEVDLIKRLKKENNPIAGKLEKASKVFEGYNKMFDTVSALAAYKALVENGIDSKQAAATTLELTNFRKTGSKMRGIKALYMFSQPTVMGAANLIRYLSTRKGQIRFAAYLAGMTALYTVLRSMDDEDEGGNKMDQLGDITRYIPIPIGGGHYFKIPVGFGMPQMAWNFSTNIVKGAVSDISLTEAGANMLVHSLKTFSPVSPSEISAAKYPMEKLTLTATPTILQPLMQNVLNRSAFGNKITTNFVRDDKLKAEQSKATTAQFWKDVALSLNDNLGIDMHPEQIKNLFDGYSSVFGSLKELNTVFIENPNREQLGRNTRMPFINQFIGTTNEFSIQSRYYEASEEARKVATEYESRKNRGALDGWLDDDKRKLIRFYEQDKSTTQTMRSEKAKLTRALRSGQISAVTYESGIKRYNKDMSRTQAQILRKYRLMEGLNTN